jgi:hypothetical protein
MGKLIVPGTNKFTSGLRVKIKLMVLRKNEMKNPFITSRFRDSEDYTKENAKSIVLQKKLKDNPLINWRRNSCKE